MSHLLSRLAAVCREHLLTEKILVVPSLAIGHQIADAVAQSGTPWVNLRVETLRTLADAIAGFELAREGVTVLSRAQALAIIEYACDRTLSSDSYFAALLGRPGLYRAIKRSIDDLRFAGTRPGSLPEGAFEDQRKGVDTSSPSRSESWMTVSNSSESWLHLYIMESIRRNLCIKIGCGLCGSQDFRRGLLRGLAKASSNERMAEAMDHETAIAIARDLARILPEPETDWEFQNAVRFLIFEIWYSIGEAKAEAELQPILDRTWAGDVLRAMKLHHEARQVEIRRQEEEQDQKRVQKRREEKRRQREREHAERLAQKVVRDRIWREKQKD